MTDRQADATKWAAAAAAALIAREAFARLRESSLKGKTVLITGGSRGLGLAMARAFAAEGANLALCARDEMELRQAHADLVARGCDALAVPCDVTDREAVQRLVSAVDRRFGGVDVLVNNAGIISAGPVSLMSEQDFADLMDVTFWGALHPTWAVLPQMRRRRSGSIVNIASIGGKAVVPHLLPYCAAKFALTALSEGLRAELAQDGIRVTTVFPGLMRTGSHVQAMIRGNREAEFTLFGAMDTLPGSSMSAHSAARRIVRAVKRGEADVTLGLPAKAMALFHGVAPGAFSDLMSVVAGLLPKGDGDPRAERGANIERRLDHPRLSDPLGLGHKAADDLNQSV